MSENSFIFPAFAYISSVIFLDPSAVRCQKVIKCGAAVPSVLSAQRSSRPFLGLSTSAEETVPSLLAYLFTGTGTIHTA